MDEIKKITHDRIKEIASSKGFAEPVLTKDYYATALLFLLKDIEGLYFKGGTALQKIYLDYSRLSEDIDYTVTGDIQKIKEKIIKAVMDSGLFNRASFDKDVEGFLRIIVHYTNFSNLPDTIFIDLNKRARLVKKPMQSKIRHFYPEEIPEFSVLTLSREELFAEKLSATIGRNKPRDHFDVYMIIKKGYGFDFKLAEKKCRQSGMEFNITRMFNKAKKLHKRWNEDMMPLLSKEIEFKEVMQTLARYFDCENAES